LVNEISLYYDARSKKHQNIHFIWPLFSLFTNSGSVKRTENNVYKNTHTNYTGTESTRRYIKIRWGQKLVLSMSVKVETVIYRWDEKTLILITCHYGSNVDICYQIRTNMKEHKFWPDTIHYYC